MSGGEQNRLRKKGLRSILSAIVLLSAAGPAGAAPVVTAAQPADGATVPVSAAVRASFSEALEPATVTTGSFRVSRFLGLKAVAAGNLHTVALRTDGTVVAWGADWALQATVPAGLSGVTAIAAGERHSAALKDDGTVVTWGNDSFGQAAAPAGLSGVAAISAGGSTRWRSRPTGRSSRGGGTTRARPRFRGASQALR